jgi:valyl-tRNA synthetase
MTPPAPVVYNNGTNFDRRYPMTPTPRPAPIPKVYDPGKVEERLYKLWMDRGYFTPTVDPSKKPYVVIMPPPNVTGELHVGHALTATIQDALVRWRRMCGDAALWLPGTDHAGIATQVVVERQLAQEGLDRHTIGREKFLERVWEWVGQSKGRIAEQHQRLGASCDWSRERFTLDEGPSRAVRMTFVNLYEKGLIYRGERLINWCPECGTALSDLEVEHHPVQGSLWYMRYPFEDGDGHVTVATTRPETYLGDTAVAVNPKDKRFKGLAGRKVVLPIVGRAIPIVTDESVDMEFGTGSVKVTPAHDPNDFEIGQRHSLEFINVMNLDATINENGGKFQGMDRNDARKAIVEEFETLGLMEKVEAHQHSVGHCQRSRTVVEPLVSEQWFVKVGSHKEPDSLAGRAHRAVVDGGIKIVPQRFTKVYLNWMENIRHWCISRQLWWGHRIPVWYCRDSGHMTVSVDDPTSCVTCGSTELEQDPDVLDTWFSSALWPHSTLGWPDETEDLGYFYPTAVMETGYDILFFWVARMIMMGLENMDEAPFQTVYLHGLIRDEAGEKMSKVKGNVVNPLKVLEQYGTDALRFALSTGTSPGNDTRLTTAKMESSRNFANKIWNTARFVLSAVDETDSFDPSLPPDLTVEDRWVLSRLNRTIGRVGQMLETFQLGEAQREIHEFLWSEFADWYIEMSKVRLRLGASPSPLPVLVHVLEQTMRLLHPFMPFVTEEVWQSIVERVPGVASGVESVMVAPYPTADPTREDEAAESDINLVIDVVTAIRNARAELKVSPSKRVEAIIDAPGRKPALLDKLDAIATLGRADPITVYGDGETAPVPDGARIAVLGGVRVILAMAGLVDLEAERTRLDKEATELSGVITSLEARLHNDAFVSKAPAAVVEKERSRLVDYQTKLSGLRDRLAELG